MATGGSASGGARTGGAATGGSGQGGSASGGSGRDAGRADGPGATGGTVSTGGNQGSGGARDAAVPDLGPDTAGASTLPPVTDYSAAGPFATVTDKNVGPGNGYTVYRPKTLGENGLLHAPIIFGPGIGMQVSQMSGMLLNFASHGFVVVGTPVLNGGPNDPNNKSAMIKGLDWIIAQNSQPGTYEGKLDVKHAISMGYSVGGTAAVEVGAHEAVATTVSIHGHTATSALHGPMLQTSGTKDTVGLPMQQKTYDSSKVQTFLATVKDADHGYIQNANGGVQRPAIVAWMRYWIYNDQGGKNYFYGDDCVMCTAPWTNPQRKNWQ